MRFCYVDESGVGQKTVLTHVGILVNAYRMRATKNEWDSRLRELATLAKHDFKELKGTKLIYGKGFWKELTDEDRHQWVTDTIGWLATRRHRLAFGAIHVPLFHELDLSEYAPIASTDVPTPWNLGALHIVLQVQRSEQRDKVKGETVFVFDEQYSFKDGLVEMVNSPPDWTDAYYRIGKAKKKTPPKLPQVVDVPYFAHSHHIGLIQLADLFASILRRHAEISDFGDAEEFVGEGARVAEWTGLLSRQMVERAHRWRSLPKDPCARLYDVLAPPSLKAATT